MSTTSQKTIVRIALQFVATLAAVWTCSTTVASGHIQAEGNGRQVIAISPDIDSTWRHTKYGWQDSSTWPVGDTFVPVNSIEQLHPFVWAGTVLIGVIAAMIWSSSEWEFDRLFEIDEEQSQ